MKQVLVADGSMKDTIVAVTVINTRLRVDCHVPRLPWSFMVNRFRSLGWTSVAALALTIPAASDSSNSPGQGQGAQAPDQRPVFKTEANYVRVDVYPTVDGHPVLDLRQDELQLLEDGV